MAGQRELLLELGLEELPSSAVRPLGEALAAELARALPRHGLACGPVQWYATPRRLAAMAADVPERREGRERLRRGPPVSRAYDETGRPTAAVLGFARSCGVPPERLETIEADGEEYLGCRIKEPECAAAALLPEAVAESIRRLPLPKRMRWGSGEIEFIRPVHWAVLLFGEEVVETEILGCPTGRHTRGHRFHRPETIPLARPADYVTALREPGRVLADYAERRARIVKLLTQAAGDAKLDLDDVLLEEVTSLVEWPTVIAGAFPERYLELPEEVLTMVLCAHQRYFPLRGADGQLLPSFLSVANVAVADLEHIRRGNERVIVPRLRDAEFFWRRDRKRSLSAYREGLKELAFHRGAGSIFDKSERLERLAAWLSDRLGQPTDPVRRAAVLCKCDLLTEIVGEFPGLQGIAGGYLARHGGEAVEVAEAIGEHYRPAYAGDAIPASGPGRVLALADKLDSIAGIYRSGSALTGEKDPYALRRSALACLRILIEGELFLDLDAALERALGGYGRDAGRDAREPILRFMLERLRAWYQERGIDPETFEAVSAVRVTEPLDFHRRIEALARFRHEPEAESLVAANKRIRNILRQAKVTGSDAPDPHLMSDAAERNLARRHDEVERELRPLLEARDYSGALHRLAQLQGAVDRFFDEVLVLCEDRKLRANRLALLSRFRATFNRLADLSLLSLPAADRKN